MFTAPQRWRAGEAIVRDMEQGAILTKKTRADGQRELCQLDSCPVRSLTLRLLLLAGWVQEATTTPELITYELDTRSPVDGVRLRQMLLETS